MCSSLGNSMERVYNFSAGPSMLPLEVLETAQKELIDYQGSGMSVMEIAEVLGVSTTELVKKLFMSMGIMATATQVIDRDTAELIAMEYDYELKDVFLEYFLDELEFKYIGYTITFAPSSKEDDNKRGYNHVEEIFYCLPNKKVKLFLKKDSYKQSEIKYKNRDKIIDHIALIKENIKGIKRVLIVDDVLTSGSTLKACASLFFNVSISTSKLSLSFLTR